MPPAWRSGGIIRKQRPQTLARSADATLDRADLAFADGRGFREAQSVGADQQDRLALMAGQLRQRIPEVGGDRPAVLVGQACGAFELAGAHHFAVEALLAVDIDEPIPQDRGQPGAEIGALLEVVAVRPGAEQRILDQVFRLVSAAAQ
jgi:hypothetical protein